MKLSIIVAVAENGVIGRDDHLPWRISGDLKRFKALTLGHHLLMGRKTFESIGRALPGRTTIVLSRGTPELPPGVAHAASLDRAIDLARAAGETEAFVAGGASVYAEALPSADSLYLTRVAIEVAGDTYFPDWDRDAWQLVSVESCPRENGEPAAAFETWKRSREGTPLERVSPMAQMLENRVGARDADLAARLDP